MGGPSAERDVSLASGAAVVRGLREAGYAVAAVDVTERRLALPAGIDAVFIALHGEYGEDGGVQAMLDERRVPYTGSGAEASRVAFDKVASKRIFDVQHVSTPAYQVLLNGNELSLPLPVVVKPSRQGSSIGVHRVTCPEAWPGAVADARAYDSEVVVEVFVPGRELTVGFVGDNALPVIEIVAPEGEYDYTAKYTRGVTEYRVPAPLDEDTVRMVQDVATRAYRALGARGFGRVDLRLSEDGMPYVLELNTIPGFTETSLLPKAAAQAGMSFAELCDRIMKLAKFG